ncbi:MAG: hypothetical protein UU47_C0026G0009 [candidate division TM6 bacterium GW2011_GWE2_41_16]|nr:MAG: hypothetical protein UU47_C0026G0009 [candidate division TM6 bacterium GW2011_GWE2_41_16]
MSIPFDLKKIEKEFGMITYERGEAYYQQNMVHSIVQMGQLYKARCKGSQPYSYFVELLIEQDAKGHKNISELKCSCPVGNDCKHVVALVLTIYHDSHEIRHQKDLMSYFSRQTKDFLIELLMELAEKDDKILERFFKIKDGKARRRRRGRETESA